MCLEALGHHATLAVDAGVALRQVASEDHFDVLLTDINLPGGDGWQLIRELGALEQLPARVISMSALTSATVAERSRTAGCHAHLFKPFTMVDLEVALGHGQARRA